VSEKGVRSALVACDLIVWGFEQSEERTEGDIYNTCGYLFRKEALGIFYEFLVWLWVCSWVE
jgi:hypothetical protein